MMVNPATFMVEVEHFLENGGTWDNERVYVDENAVITTPYHVYLNRAREYARGVAKHGTTGMGIGETVVDAMARPTEVMRCRHLKCGSVEILSRLKSTFEARLSPDLIGELYTNFTKATMIISHTEVVELLRAQETMVFEGAQGVMLDENYGLHPHTTWSTTTARNALHILADAELFHIPTLRVGVTRTYGTRHGAGPFPAEDYDLRFPEKHNGDDGMAGQFRQGWLDIPMLRYAITCNGGIDRLVVNHADCKPEKYQRSQGAVRWIKPTSVRDQERMCRQAWDRPPESAFAETPGNFPEVIAEELGVPLLATGYGPSANDKQVNKEEL
jgi:adenylosuccinate synthase